MERKEIKTIKRSLDYAKPIINTIVEHGWNVDGARFALEKAVFYIGEDVNTALVENIDKD